MSAQAAGTHHDPLLLPPDRVEVCRPGLHKRLPRPHILCGACWRVLGRLLALQAHRLVKQVGAPPEGVCQRCSALLAKPLPREVCLRQAHAAAVLPHPALWVLQMRRGVSRLADLCICIYGQKLVWRGGQAIISRLQHPMLKAASRPPWRCPHGLFFKTAVQHQDCSATLASAGDLAARGPGCARAGKLTSLSFEMSGCPGHFPWTFDRMVQLDKTTMLQQYCHSSCQRPRQKWQSASSNLVACRRGR